MKNINKNETAWLNLLSCLTCSAHRTTGFVKGPHAFTSLNLAYTSFNPWSLEVKLLLKIPLCKELKWNPAGVWLFWQLSNSSLPRLFGTVLHDGNTSKLMSNIVGSSIMKVNKCYKPLQEHLPLTRFDSSVTLCEHPSQHRKCLVCTASPCVRMLDAFKLLHNHNL